MIIAAAGQNEATQQQQPSTAHPPPQAQELSVKMGGFAPLVLHTNRNTTVLAERRAVPAQNVPWPRPVNPRIIMKEKTVPLTETGSLDTRVAAGASGRVSRPGLERMIIAGSKLRSGSVALGTIRSVPECQTIQTLKSE